MALSRYVGTVAGVAYVELHDPIPDQRLTEADWAALQDPFDAQPLRRVCRRRQRFWFTGTRLSLARRWWMNVALVTEVRLLDPMLVGRGRDGRNFFRAAGHLALYSDQLVLSGCAYCGATSEQADGIGRECLRPQPPTEPG